MRIFENKSNPWKRMRIGDHIEVSLEQGRMGMDTEDAMRLALVTKRGREFGVYLTEQERVALVRRLLREGEWVMGLPQQ